MRAPAATWHFQTFPSERSASRRASRLPCTGAGDPPGRELSDDAELCHAHTYHARPQSAYHARIACKRMLISHVSSSRTGEASSPVSPPKRIACDLEIEVAPPHPRGGGMPPATPSAGVGAHKSPPCAATVRTVSGSPVVASMAKISPANPPAPSWPRSEGDTSPPKPKTAPPRLKEALTERGRSHSEGHRAHVSPSRSKRRMSFVSSPANPPMSHNEAPSDEASSVAPPRPATPGGSGRRRQERELTQNCKAARAARVDRRAEQRKQRESRSRSTIGEVMPSPQRLPPRFEKV